MTNLTEKVQEETIEEKKWCVYMHISPSLKKYVGITGRDPVVRWGKNGSRYLEKKNGKYVHPAMANALLKYPNWDEWEHHILFSDLTEKQAKAIEKYLIQTYNTRDYKCGYNCTDGGDGASGLIMSDESKEKMSIKAKERYKDKTNHPMYGVHKYGKENPMYGKHHSEEAKRKISIAREGVYVGEKNPMFGKQHTEQTRKKMSQNHVDFSHEKHPRSTSVYCVELNEIFWGATDAKNKYGFRFSSISSCCKQEYGHKTAGTHPVTKEKLHWYYVYDYINKDGKTIQGAISLGYVTEEQVNKYLNSLKKETDSNGTVEEKRSVC